MPRKKILAVVDDLLFTVKIGDAAKRAGLDVDFMKSEKDVLASVGEMRPLLIIIDLNSNSVEPVQKVNLVQTPLHLGCYRGIEPGPDGNELLAGSIPSLGDQGYHERASV